MTSISDTGKEMRAALDFFADVAWKDQMISDLRKALKFYADEKNYRQGSGWQGYPGFMRWVATKIRDISRGYSDADVESMRRKLASGKRKFTDREHSAYVCEVQQGNDDQAL